MKLLPNIIDETELRLLNRKGAATMAIFKVVTVVVIAYCAQSIYRGQDPSTVALAYLAFAPVVLAVFTGGNVVEHAQKAKVAVAEAEAKS